MTRTEKVIAAFILLTAPLAIYALARLQPTFDDWTYLTYPNEDPQWQRYFLPYGSYWRPIDALIGYVLALDLRLFPILNHTLIYFAHLTGMLMVYLIGRRLQYALLPRIIAPLFFLLSPAMLGAVLGIDSINQVLSSTLGLIALWCYLGPSKHRLWLWPTLCLFATLAKENGICWLFIVPLLGYAFRITDRRQLRRHLAIALGCVVAYSAIRLSLPNGYALDENQYLAATFTDKLNNVAKFLILSFSCVDFISLFHQPSRHIPFLLLTLLLSIPFIYLLVRRGIAHLKERETLVLLLTILLAASPHLLTLFSTMHAYAALGLIALLVGHILNRGSIGRRTITVTFAMYMASALMVDARHYTKTYDSGMTGYRMGESVILQAHKPANKVWCICIDNGEKKYSSFCVIPYDAFGWGNAVYLHTHHRWPTLLRNETITTADARAHLAHIVGQRLAQGYDQVWIVDGEKVKVIEK